MSTIIERLPSSSFRAKDVNYADIWGLHDLFSKIAFKTNLALVGPKGVGKTLSVQSFAAKHKYNIVTFDCSEDVRRNNLLGMYVLRGNQTPFILGPVTTAIEVANDTGSCILVLEELNGLSPQMQKVLNPLSDFRRRIEVPECGRVFELKNNAKLWVVGTMNTSAYGGVYALNEDLKSRFRMLPLGYPKQEEELLIVKSHFGDNVDKTLFKRIMLLSQETRQRAMEYALSTRDLIQVIEDSKSVGIETALRLVIGKFEGDDRKTVVQRIHSIFGVNIEDEGAK
jgi:nitric oxide reductase NorQ protein